MRWDEYFRKSSIDITPFAKRTKKSPDGGATVHPILYMLTDANSWKCQHVWR